MKRGISFFGWRGKSQSSQPQEGVERAAVKYMLDSLRFELTCSLNFYSPKLSEDIQSLAQAEVLFTGHK
jgi:hypothetical protein